jgi:hypothetical protein
MSVSPALRATTAAGPPRPGFAVLSGAVLLAAAAGALLAAARPGALALGACAVAVYPLAALLLAGPARAATIGGTLAFVAALAWAYRTQFSPLYAYEGLVDLRPAPSAILIAAALAALPAGWLPLAARRPSTIVVWFLYLIGFVPTIVVPVFIVGDLDTLLPFDAALLGCMAILVAMLRLPPAPLRLPHLSPAAFTHVLVALGVLSSLYIVVGFGLHAPPGLGDVYATRAQFDSASGGAPGSGYIAPWAGNVINPLLMTLGAARRRASLAALGFMGQLLIYSVTGYKSVLFAIVLVPLVYIAVSRANRSFGLLLAVGTPAILFAAILGHAILGEWSIALTRRLFAVPGQVAWYYFDYFSIHPADHLAHSFLRWFDVPSVYGLNPAVLIGQVRYPGFGTDVNAGLWPDAYSNFRFAGMVGLTLLFGLVLLVADGLGRGKDARVVGPLLAMAGLTLADSALFTTLLTHGLGATCVLLALMPPAKLSPGT